MIPKKILQALLAIFFLISSKLVIADTLPVTPPELTASNQLLLVIAPSWDTPYGALQHFQRKNSQQKWIAASESIPVVIGKKGMAWGIDLQKYHLHGPLKKEGDLKSPVGIFKIGPLFGFDPKGNPDFKIQYVSLNNTSTCIVDTKSNYYNQLIDRTKIPSNLNISGTNMRQISEYRWGSIIQYNSSSIKGAGSCIFLHIWKNSNEGTSGCVAMSETLLKKILQSLDSARNPVIGLFSKEAYLAFRDSWGLPIMEIPSLRPDASSSVVCVDSTGNIMANQSGVCAYIQINR